MAPDDEKARGRAQQSTIVAQVSPLLVARDRGVLTILSGPDVGRVVSVPGPEPMRMGRSDDCAVVFDDPSLSRVHASVRRVASDFILQDEGSTNGTFVNDTRVPGSVTLRDGDRIKLGNATTLRFQLVDEAEEQALKRVYEAGRRDALTGLSNRQAFEERFAAEHAFAVRHKAPLCVAMMDVDFFKKVNDTHGHPAGDAVLKAVAAALAKGVRAEDLVARYGGEEFVMIMRGIDVFNACLLADRLRSTVGATPVAHENKTIAVTMSVGVASLECMEKPDKGRLLTLADERLYKAKQSGRNKVVGP